MTAMDWSDRAACRNADPDLFFPLGEEENWMDLALCAEADPEAWFPEKGGSARPAKRICRRCEVREECLAYALEHNIRWGVWGGLSEQERKRIRRQAAGRAA